MRTTRSTIALWLILFAATASAQVPAPDVTLDTATCAVTISAEPPDDTGGWTVQFQREGGISVGQKDSSPPYERSTKLDAGPHTFTAKWTKQGGHVVMSAAVLRPCPKPEPPPPPPPKDCVPSEWSEWTTVAGSETPWICTNETETRTFVQKRTRTIVTPAEPGGAVCNALEEVQTQTETRPCVPASADAFAYFKMLAARPTATASYALQEQAQIEQYSMAPPNTQISGTPEGAVMRFVSPVSGLGGIGGQGNMLALPSNIGAAFTTLVATWDAWFGPDFIPYSGHQKHFRLSSPWTWGAPDNPWDQGGRWVEIQSFWERATPGNVAKLDLRTYGRLGPNANDAALDDGIGHTLTPFQIAKAKWTRYWAFVERVAGGWEEGGFDRVSIWAADEDREPVQILDRLQMEAGTQGISDLRVQISTDYTWPEGTILDHKIRGVVFLKDEPNVTSLLQKPVR